MAETMTGGEILDVLSEVTTAPALIAQTGGGTATIFVGVPGPDDQYTIAIGPGQFDWQNARRSLFWLTDLYVGPDDHGDSLEMVEVVNRREDFEPAVRRVLKALDERLGRSS